ncbi:hypothetical protein [Nonomuraea sp. NPDC049141]|uniref:hypothetical protein n=1 Tax=Nonomuraea sp. NPDC049141 TaxID=3155500 RepID=UPI0033C2A096
MLDDPDDREFLFFEHGLDLDAPADKLEQELTMLRWSVWVYEVDQRLRDVLAAVPRDRLWVGVGLARRNGVRVCVLDQTHSSRSAAWDGLPSAAL